MAADRRSPRYIWLDEGLKILEEEGFGALSIENLGVRTGKTKGSFYHHFKNRESYIEALLNYYDEITEVKIDENDTLEHLKKLTDKVFQISSRLELVIRAWALYDPHVKTFQDRMDKKRLEHLKSIYRSSDIDESRLEFMAFKNYSIYIGLQQLKHLYEGKDFKRLLKGTFVS